MLPMQQQSSEERRGFLKALTAAISGAIAAVAVIPGLGFLAHPLRQRTVSGADEPLKVATTDELAPGKPVRVNIIGQRRDAWLRQDRVKLGACWLIRPIDGPVRAYSTVCPHLGCGVDWNDKTKTFDCPCHASSFDTSGRCLGGPSPRGLDELEVVTSGEDIKVRHQRFKLGHREKEPIG
jgi:menaquinol-cytochrome c reductase iron-sulfur subunit